MSSRLSAKNIYLKNLLEIQKEPSNSTTVKFSFSFQKKKDCEYSRIKLYLNNNIFVWGINCPLNNGRLLIKH